METLCMGNGVILEGTEALLAGPSTFSVGSSPTISQSSSEYTEEGGGLVSNSPLFSCSS